MLTQIGDDCLLMAQAHVAHDCITGNGVIMANAARSQAM
jgi:UDP-N-acetylglucosamine acyltransferase